MTRRLFVTPEAEADMAAAELHYNSIRAGLGDEFLDCVETVFGHICGVSGAGKEVLPGVRRFVVRRFPYSVFFRPDSDQVAVLAVYHNKRDPAGWPKRFD